MVLLKGNIMENQHEKIKGYRDLSQEEIDLMNEIKEKAEEVGGLVEKIHQMFLDEKENNPDPRWISIAKTDLQKGFMALIRSVAKPTSF